MYIIVYVMSEAVQADGLHLFGFPCGELTRAAAVDQEDRRDAVLHGGGVQKDKRAVDVGIARYLYHAAPDDPVGLAALSVDFGNGGQDTVHTEDDEIAVGNSGSIFLVGLCQLVDTENYLTVCIIRLFLVQPHRVIPAKTSDGGAVVGIIGVVPYHVAAAVQVVGLREGDAVLHGQVADPLDDGGVADTAVEVQGLGDAPVQRQRVRPAEGERGGAHFGLAPRLRQVVDDGLQAVGRVVSDLPVVVEDAPCGLPDAPDGVEPNLPQGVLISGVVRLIHHNHIRLPRVVDAQRQGEGLRAVHLEALVEVHA